MQAQVQVQFTDQNRPAYVFAVQPRTDRAAEFERLREAHGSVFAFHGSAFENFHSILHNGFCNHMNRTKLFGHGTYLSQVMLQMLWNMTTMGMTMKTN